MTSTLTASSSTRTRTTATTAEEGGGDDGGAAARARLIDYARRAHAYKLTPAEAEEILRCDYWQGVDDFVTYMRQFPPPPCASDDGDDDAGGGGGEDHHHPTRAVNATKDVVVPGLHLYTDSEIEAMDAWDEDEDDETEEEEDVEDVVTDGYADVVDSRWVVSTGCRYCYCCCCCCWCVVIACYRCERAKTRRKRRRASEKDNGIGGFHHWGFRGRKCPRT